MNLILAVALSASNCAVGLNFVFEVEKQYTLSLLLGPMAIMVGVVHNGTISIYKKPPLFMFLYRELGQ